MTPNYILDENGEPMLDENGEPMEDWTSRRHWLLTARFWICNSTSQEEYDQINGALEATTHIQL